MSDAQAEEFIHNAEKKLRSFSLFSGTTKFEEAAELYSKAANQYKISKKWDEAALAFIKAAENYLKAKSKHEAATNYINAANCYRKTNTSEAIRWLRQAIELLTDDGRFSIAAKHQKEIAEMYEQESNFEEAMQAYQTAADYYEGENSPTAAQQCLLKVAEYAAQLGKFDRAIELFDKIALDSADSNLLKWNCPKYYLRAVICMLCADDLVSAKRAFERYKDREPAFEKSREGKLVAAIIAAYEKYDVDAFTTAVVEFDSISKLDPWTTSLLLKIKNAIKGASGQRGGEGGEGAAAGAANSLA